MEPENRHGTIWSADELDAIVADYFAMLGDELARRPYVKSHHSAGLMTQIGRSHRSVEFKHQNISAVLDELGLPWIAGYIPKPNYQGAIFDAIERYLTRHQDVLYFIPERSRSWPEDQIFVEAPAPKLTKQTLPRELKRLVRKFDPVDRDRANRSLGEAGEAFVVAIEKKRLENAQRADLAKRVRWVSKDDGDGAGYDIHSFRESGSDRLIEVKTTNGAARTPFFLSRNEYDLASERPNDWCIYRVYLFAQQPKIFTLIPPIEDAVQLSTEVWRASF